MTAAKGCSNCQQFLMISGHSLYHHLLYELRPYSRGIIGKMQGVASPDKLNFAGIEDEAGIPRAPGRYLYLSAWEA